MSYPPQGPQEGAPSYSGHPPVCPRHPDRQSFVSCQRCGRPACSECQRPAAVGIHCVDCVAQAQAQRPVRRTQFGAEVRPGQRPIVTYTVIAVCLIVYLIQVAPQYLGSVAPWPDITRQFSYAPAFTSSYTFIPFEPWRMMTSAFLHSPSSVMHIAFNMMALYFIGQMIEPAIGRLRYCALLLISAFGGSVAVLYLSDPTSATVGASGAVFGLIGALFVLTRATGGQTGGILALVAINMAMSFIVPNISWQGHLGGLITGVLCALVISRVPAGPQRSLWQGVGLVGVTLLLVILTAIGVPLVSLEYY